MGVVIPAVVEWRFSNTDVDLINNLVTHNLMPRQGGSANLPGNLSNQSLSLFVDGRNGDLHFDSGAGAAIDQAEVFTPETLCVDDFDGQQRPIGSAGDIGADEYGDGSGNASDDDAIGDNDNSSGSSDNNSGGGGSRGGCFIDTAGR